MDLTTVTALRKFGTFTSEKDDTFLAAIVSSASRIIELNCNRKFAVEEEVAHTFTRRSVRYAGLIDHFDGPVLLLDGEIAEVASAITAGGVAVTAVSYLTPYEPPYWAIVLDEGAWVSPVVVTAYWAYSREPPPDIEYATLRTSKYLYELRETTRGDAVVVTEQGEVLMPPKLPADIMALIAPYIRPKMAR